jgi:hypothetical protein
MRTYSPSQSTLAPEIPLHLMGWGDLGKLEYKRRSMSGVMAPRIPLHNLGAGVPTGPMVVGSSAPIAGAITTSVISSMATAGSTLAAAAGPIGMAVAVVVGEIASLWAAHDARAAGAKTENAAVSSAVQAFDGSLKAIFAAANAGTLSAADAINQCQILLQTFWQRMAPYMTGPGRADASGGGSNCGTVNPAAACSGMTGGHACDKSCTVTCCVGCQNITPTIWQAIQSLQGTLPSNSQGIFNACPIAGDKYGLAARGSYTLQYIPPPAGAVSSIESALGGGGGSMLPLLLIGLAAYLVLQ